MFLLFPHDFFILLPRLHGLLKRGLTHYPCDYKFYLRWGWGVRSCANKCPLHPIAQSTAHGSIASVACLLLHISKRCTSCTSHIANALAGNLRNTYGALQHWLKTQGCLGPVLHCSTLARNEIDSSRDIAVGCNFCCSRYFKTSIPIIPFIDSPQPLVPIWQSLGPQHPPLYSHLCPPSHRHRPKDCIPKVRCFHCSIRT